MERQIESHPFEDFRHRLGPKYPGGLWGGRWTAVPQMLFSGGVDCGGAPDSGATDVVLGRGGLWGGHWTVVPQMLFSGGQPRSWLIALQALHFWVFSF